MPDLEAKLATCFVFSGSGNSMNLSVEQKGKVWATVFAIKVFETQLAEERAWVEDYDGRQVC
jgi:hypothetical protein